jgi:16S rRNA (guanine966-N2)-methyltransferase
VRVIGGTWAGQDLVSPAGRVRPTAEPLRAIIMKLTERDLRGARILDLFAGTGALGIEALSRGAGSCDFVENSGAALHALKANIASFRLRDRTRVFDRDAIPFVERLAAHAYDIAFADPPYGSRKLDRIIARWQEVPYSRLLVLEHAIDHEGLPAPPARKLEDSAVTVLRARAERKPRSHDPRASSD